MGIVSIVNIRKARLIWGFAILGMIASALLVVGKARAETLGFSLEAAPAFGTSAKDLLVRVLDEQTQQPLADATVSVADSLDDGAAGEQGLTGIDGNLLFKDALARPRALTVSKPGYSSLSILGVQSAQATVYLKSLPKALSRPVNADPAIASGMMNGWAPITSGNVVHAGLVFRSLSAFDLLHFEPDSLISPLKDTIDVMGRREIPSNLVLPEQEIFLLFGSITLNKPTFRLPLVRGKETRLAGIQGTIAVRDLLGVAQGGGKISMELLNKLSFNRAGMTGSFRPDQDFRANVNANLALRPAHKVTVSAPPFRGDVLVAAATDVDGDRLSLLPTDIKLAVSAESPSQIKPITLSAAEARTGKSREVFTIAMADKGKRLTGIINGNAGATVAPGAFLQSDALADAPALPEKVALRPLATGLSAALLEAPGAPVWYVYSLPSAGVNQVPTSRFRTEGRVNAYSVMQLDFGPGFDERTLNGKTAMRGLQRFARSTAKIGRSLY